MYAHLHDPPPSAVETAPGTPGGLDAVIEQGAREGAAPALPLRGRPRPRRARGARPAPTRRSRSAAWPPGTAPGRPRIVHRRCPPPAHRPRSPDEHPAPAPPSARPAAGARPAARPRPLRRPRGAARPRPGRPRSPAAPRAAMAWPCRRWRRGGRARGCRGVLRRRRGRRRPGRVRRRPAPPARPGAQGGRRTSRRATARTASPWTATPSGSPTPRGTRSPALDATTNKATGEPVPVGRNPDSVAVADGVVWVTNTDDGTVSRIEADGARVNDVPVGAGPEGLVARRPAPVGRERRRGTA